MDDAVCDGPLVHRAHDGLLKELGVHVLLLGLACKQLAKSLDRLGLWTSGRKMKKGLLYMQTIISPLHT